MKNTIPENTRITISEPRLVYAPEMCEAISAWGVYAIPRMWREPTGELVVRFNGEEDSADIDNLQKAPNLYFVSWDDGETWTKSEREYDISMLTGIDPPFFKLNNGNIAFLKSDKNVKPIKNLPYLKEFVTPCRDAIVRSYRYGDIPNECKCICFGQVDTQLRETSMFEAVMDFPEREVLVNAKANSNGEFVPVEEHIQPFVFKLPYFSAVRQLQDGTLVAVCCGQNANVENKFYSEVYLIASKDGGRTWKKRAVVAGGVSDLPYGYGGDGGELSLTVDAAGSLYCVMRMDLSTHPELDPHPIGAVFCASHDGGYHWSEPRFIAEGSVTPHITTMGEDVLVMIYGRPGVHCKFSFDKGETWSAPYTLVGKTLSEERALGRSDYESKCGDADSYCNSFWERLSDNSILVLFNNLRYPDKNGVPTKAAFVRKITVESK